MSNPSFMTRTANTRDDWQTPKYIIDALGEFDLDPAANPLNPSRCAMRGYWQDGLTLPWEGRVWLNPPYGRECRLWLKKMAEHGHGIALVPPRMGSQWFQRIVLDSFDAILFLRGRIAFLGPDGVPVTGNNADSILIAYGGKNRDALREAVTSHRLQGRLWTT